MMRPGLRISRTCPRVPTSTVVPPTFRTHLQAPSGSPPGSRRLQTRQRRESKSAEAVAKESGHTALVEHLKCLKQHRRPRSRSSESQCQKQPRHQADKGTKPTPQAARPHMQQLQVQSQNSHQRHTRGASLGASHEVVLPMFQLKDLRRLKAPKLRQLCEERGVAVAGGKAALIHSLLAAQGKQDDLRGKARRHAGTNAGDAATASRTGSGTERTAAKRKKRGKKKRRQGRKG